MEYIIKNHKNVYIRLNSNGRPVTCVEHDKTLFEFSKAKNIVDSLPKSLKRLRFKVEAIPEIIVRQEKKVIEKENYLVSANITEWIEKFGICDDILKGLTRIEVKEIDTLSFTGIAIFILLIYSVFSKTGP